MSVTDPEKQALELQEARRELQVMREKRGAGGTPGGVGTFFLGVLLAVVGGYLVLNQVTVTSTYSFFGLWGMGRAGGFGLTMLPMLVGVGMLFFNGKSKVAWLVTFLGLAMILAAVLMSMSIVWAPTSLFNTLVMFVMLAGGIGLIIRSLRPYPAS
jgi:hypothetical protein